MRRMTDGVAVPFHSCTAGSPPGALRHPPRCREEGLSLDFGLFQRLVELHCRTAWL